MHYNRNPPPNSNYEEKSSELIHQPLVISQFWPSNCSEFKQVEVSFQPQAIKDRMACYFDHRKAAAASYFQVSAAQCSEGRPGKPGLGLALDIDSRYSTELGKRDNKIETYLKFWGN